MDERAPSATASGSGGFALTQADIDEFKGIVGKEFGVEISDRDAWARVIELLHLVRSLLGPIPEDPERFSGVSHVSESMPRNWGNPSALE
jgi:hypothetical protein